MWYCATVRFDCFLLYGMNSDSKFVDNICQQVKGIQINEIFLSCVYLIVDRK